MVYGGQQAKISENLHGATSRPREHEITAKKFSKNRSNEYLTSHVWCVVCFVNMSQKPKVVVKETPAIMRVFNAKGEYKELLESVKEFKHPIDFNSSQTQTIVKFFEFASSKIPEVRSTSTGREYEMQSNEANRYFGETLARSMYVTMNKVTYLMTCK